MDLRIYGELWAHISNPHRNANCKCQGLRPRPTHSGHSPRKGRTESLTRKTVHQTQVPAACLYLSSVLCHTGRFCLAFLKGCALLEGRSHQLLAERRQERHEEHLCGGRFEHSQPQTSGLQEQFLHSLSAATTLCRFCSQHSSQELLTCGGFAFPALPSTTPRTRRLRPYNNRWCVDFTDTSRQQKYCPVCPRPPRKQKDATWTAQSQTD